MSGEVLGAPFYLKPWWGSTIENSIDYSGSRLFPLFTFLTRLTVIRLQQARLLHSVELAEKDDVDRGRAHRELRDRATETRSRVCPAPTSIKSLEGSLRPSDRQIFTPAKSTFPLSVVFRCFFCLFLVYSMQAK